MALSDAELAQIVNAVGTHNNILTSLTSDFAGQGTKTFFGDKAEALREIDGQMRTLSGKLPEAE
jgi:hypothetical protein